MLLHTQNNTRRVWPDPYAGRLCWPRTYDGDVAVRLLQVLRHQLLGAPQAGCHVLRTRQRVLLAGDAPLPLAEVRGADQLLALRTETHIVKHNCKRESVTASERRAQSSRCKQNLLRSKCSNKGQCNVHAELHDVQCPMPVRMKEAVLSAFDSGC